MDQITKTSNEIKELRQAFRLEYEKFQTQFNDLGKRFYELSKQADLLLSFLEKLNQIEINIDKL